MKDPLRDLPGYALRRAAATTMARFGTVLEPIGLKISELSALLLVEANRTITASQLGRMLDIQRANMVPLIARLIERGLLERQPLDGKSHSLHLTAEGQALLARGKDAMTAFEDDLVSRVPEPHRDHLKPALDALWRG